MNPTPWAVMTGNCIGWIVYSYLIKNWFIFWANAPGLLMSIWLNMAAAKLQYCDGMSRDMRTSVVKFLEDTRKSLVIPSGDATASESSDSEAEKTKSPHQQLVHGTKEIFKQLTSLASDITIQKSGSPAPHEKVVVAVVAIWLTIITLISFLDLDLEQRELFIGVCVNLNMSFFYGAPLSTMYTVLRKWDSSSIHFWTMVMNTACALFFMLFGVGLGNYVLIVPNGIGVLLGILQMFLRIVVPNKDKSTSTVAPKQDESKPSPIDNTDDTDA